MHTHTYPRETHTHISGYDTRMGMGVGGCENAVGLPMSLTSMIYKYNVYTSKVSQLECRS